MEPAEADQVFCVDDGEGDGDYWHGRRSILYTQTFVLLIAFIADSTASSWLDGSGIVHALTAMA